MAVAPPLDVIPKIPMLVISRIQTTILDIVNDLSARVLDLEILVNSIPKTANCSDGRLIDAVEKINQITQIFELLQSIKPILANIGNILTIVSSIASAIKVGLLVFAVPVPAAVSEVLALQNQIISNIFAVANTLNTLANTIDAIIQPYEQTLSVLIGKLTAICPTLQFDTPVLDNQLDALQSEINNQLNDLISQQENIFVTYTDPETDLFRGIAVPANDVGKTGDYFIDTENRVIYGPKPSNAEWGTGKNY